MDRRRHGLLEQICDRWQSALTTPMLSFEDERGARTYTGAQLLEMAGRYAAGLADKGVEPGDRVGILLTTGEEFVGAFFGTWWLGAVAVPLAPPSPRQNLEQEGARLFRALMAAQARVAVVPPPLRAMVPFSPIPLLVPEELQQAGGLAEPRDRLDLALIQFSSGSTGHPKGVALAARHLDENIRAINSVLEGTTEDRGVSWLPLYHDMGLIGSLLYTQYVGFHTLLMPPEHFIRMPARWLRAVSDQRATMSVAPNFAYQLCARLPETATQRLDLSAWRIAMIGAEPIRPATLRDFAARFASCGFQAGTFLPTYGLAEATVAVSMTPPGRGMTTDRISARAFETEQRAEPSQGPDARELVAVGPQLPGVEIEIRAQDGRVLGERELGEVWVSSPALMSGYFQAPEATADVVQGGWLRTGDLGYRADGQLYIAGRLKDLIIRGGSKYHPQDLEAIAEAHPSVRLGGAAAFVAPGQELASERVVMIVELRRDAAQDPELAHTLRTQILEATGLRLDEIVLVASYQLPKTTSGKIRRAETRKRYLAGAFAPTHA